MRRREFITPLGARQFMAATAFGFIREHRDDNHHT
jgi:hypothetical protein